MVAPQAQEPVVRAGLLFQYPGALLSALAGVGASRFLRNPPAWLHAVTAGGAQRHDFPDEASS